MSSFNEYDLQITSIYQPFTEELSSLKEILQKFHNPGLLNEDHIIDYILYCKEKLALPDYDKCINPITSFFEIVTNFSTKYFDEDTNTEQLIETFFINFKKLNIPQLMKDIDIYSQYCIDLKKEQDRIKSSKIEQQKKNADSRKKEVDEAIINSRNAIQEITILKEQMVLLIKKNEELEAKILSMAK